MSISVRYTDDAGEALSSARSFLETRPVEHNLVLSIINQCIAEPRPGHYWRVLDDDSVVGVALQTPTHFQATLTPLLGPPLEALVEAIATRAPGVPGVVGEASTVVAFAGHWAETQRVAVSPVEARRMYRLRELRAPRPTPGNARAATQADCDIACRWIVAFHDDIGEPPPLDPIESMQRRINEGQLWIWDDSGPTSMVGFTAAVAGVARIAPVYTPPEFRRNGYAAACTAAVSAHLLENLDECVLYTQLANPTSNAIYRAIGYEPVHEVLRYSFGPATT